MIQYHKAMVEHMEMLARHPEYFEAGYDVEDLKKFVEKTKSELH
jgi:hypothetical protein